MSNTYDLGPILTEITNEEIESIVKGEKLNGLKVLTLSGLTFLWNNIDTSKEPSSSSTRLIKAEEFGGSNTDFEDSYSQKVLSQAAIDSEYKIADVLISDIPLGSYSIVTRMQTTTIANPNDFMSISVYSVAPDDTEILLETVNVKSTYFSEADSWETVSFGVNFSGKRNSKMKIVFNSLSVSNTPVVNYAIDYVSIQPSGTALGSIG